MIKKLSLALALAMLGACSSESDTKESTKNQSNDSVSQEQLSADRSGVEAYEQNATTVSGEINGKNFDNKLKDDELASALREGGHVIYLRHTRTVKDWGDQVSPALDLADCNTQRRLSTQGKMDATMIGEGIKAADIPVGDVISSEYCRAYNTADLAFGVYTKNSNLNFLPCVECTPDQYQEYAMRLQPLMSAKPEAGTNTVLVGHDDPFQGVTMPVIPKNGIYPAPMGVAYVVKPLGAGKFDLIAKIEPDQWPALAQK
jgi:phosphohistidine phosphatase SixA